MFLRSSSKSGVGQGWRPHQIQTRNRPKPGPRKHDLIGSRNVPRLRRSMPRRRIRPLLMWHPRQRAESFPSLVPDESLRRTLQDAAPTPTESDPPSRAPKRPPVRPPKRRDQASKSPRRNPGFSSDENAPLAESASTTSQQTASAQSVDGGVSPRALSAKAKRKDKIAISRDNVREKHLPNDQRSPLGTDSPATLPSIVDDPPPQSRKRTIIARYVFGDALKPGERWKRRLLTMPG